MQAEATQADLQAGWECWFLGDLNGESLYMGVSRPSYRGGWTVVWSATATQEQMTGHKARIRRPDGTTGDHYIGRTTLLGPPRWDPDTLTITLHLRVLP